MTAEEERPPGLSDDEWIWQRRADRFRLLFDTLFPPAALSVALVMPLVVLFTPSLQTPQAGGTIAGFLLTLAGIAVKMRPKS